MKTLTIHSGVSGQAAEKHEIGFSEPPGTGADEARTGENREKHRDMLETAPRPIRERVIQRAVTAAIRICVAAVLLAVIGFGLFLSTYRGEVHSPQWTKEMRR